MPAFVRSLFDVIDGIDASILADHINAIDGVLTPKCTLPPAVQESLRGLLSFLTDFHSALVVDEQ